MKQMTRDDRQAIMDHELGWLNDMAVHEVDGKLMLGDADLPFNVHTILTEEEFQKKWLMQFALGNDFGKNYFDVDAWYHLTNRGTQAVLVVDKDRKPAAMVLPLTSSNLTPQDYEMLRHYAKHMRAHKANEQGGRNPGAPLAAARELGKHLQATRRTITDLVSDEFYAKYNIIPDVEKKVYYIKDHLNPSASIEEINRTREILYRDHKKEKVTREEYQFLHQVSRGEFIIEDKLDQPVIGQQEAAGDVDPLEC